MSTTTFINTSKTQISSELQSRLNEGAQILRAQLDHDGIQQADWPKLVGVFLLGPTAASTDYALIKKTDLRDFVDDLQKRARRKLPIYESTIARCLEEGAPGSMRVLYVSDESCGTMKLFYDEQAVKSQRLQDRLEEAIGAAKGYMNEEQLDLVKDIHEKIKDLPHDEAMQVVMDAELATSEELAELRALRVELGEAEEDVMRDYFSRLPDFRERWKSVLARVQKAVIPPDTNSANNLETVLMAAAYVFDRVTVGTGLSKEETSYFIGRFAKEAPLVQKLLRRIGGILRGQPFSGSLQGFGIEWMRQGFPKLEVGQKLAATLAMTEVPADIEVVAPWKAWSLIVPPGLFGEASEKEGDLARLWCMGTEVHFVVLSKGGLVGEIREYKLKEIFKESGTAKLWEAINSLVKGACLALSNPDDYKREKLKDRHSKAPKKQRDGEPDFGATRFMLSAPVQIDLRQTLLDELAGKKRAPSGGSPTVQFFVRGHWRNQAHGPGRSLRKQIRIEGFWKGPEEGRVLLRNYKVKEEEKVKDGG